MTSNNTTYSPNVAIFFEEGMTKCRQIYEDRGEARGFERGLKAGMKKTVKLILDSCATRKLRRELGPVLRRALGEELVPEDIEGDSIALAIGDGEEEEEIAATPPTNDESSKQNEEKLVNPPLVAIVAASSTDGPLDNAADSNETHKNCSMKKSAPANRKRPTGGQNKLNRQVQKAPPTTVARTNITKEDPAQSKAHGAVAGLQNANKGSTQLASNATQRRSSDVWFCKKVHRFLDDMETIVETPYKENASAEVGEGCFQHLFQNILVEKAVSRRDFEVPQEAKDLLLRHAKTVVKTYYKIRKSGILFSDSWKSGKFADAQCGALPTEMLVLLLQASRFPNSETDVLRRMFQELDVFGLFHKAMTHWYGAKDLGEGDFPLFHQAKRKQEMIELLSTLTSHSRGTIKKSHLLCILFASRAFQCLDTLQFRFKLKGTLQTKVVRCIWILHSAIEQRLGQGTYEGPRNQEAAAATGRQGLVQSSNADGAVLPSNSSCNRHVSLVESDVLPQGKGFDAFAFVDEDSALPSSSTGSSNRRVPRVSDLMPQGKDSDAFLSIDEDGVSSDDGIVALKFVGPDGAKSQITDHSTLSPDISNRPVPRVSDVLMPQSSKHSAPSNDGEDDISVGGEGGNSPPNMSAPAVLDERAKWPTNVTSPYFTPPTPYFGRISPAYTPPSSYDPYNIRTRWSEGARPASVARVEEANTDGDEQWVQQGTLKKPRLCSKEEVQVDHHRR